MTFYEEIIKAYAHKVIARNDLPIINIHCGPLWKWNNRPRKRGFVVSLRARKHPTRDSAAQP